MKQQAGIPVRNGRTGRPKGTYKRSVWDSLKKGRSVYFPNHYKGLIAYNGLRQYIKTRQLTWIVTSAREGKGLRIWRTA